jgi:DNA-binding response OmpR family regulator
LEVLSGGTIPDLMVMDIRLPDMPGPEVALRIHERHPHIPVLFVSGWTEGLADAELLASLRWDFLPKPFTGEELINRVRRLLG